MKRIKIMALPLVVLCCLMLVGPSRAMHSTQYAINWGVVGTGGAPMHSTSYSADGTAGQLAPGSSHGTNYDLCAGYWCGTAVAYRTCLPLILHDVDT